MKQTFIPFDILGKFLISLLDKAGIPGDDAEIIADVMLQADKLGFDSHGVNRVKSIYLDRIREGILNPVTNIEIVRESPATAVVDGHNGWDRLLVINR